MISKKELTDKLKGKEVLINDLEGVLEEKQTCLDTANMALESQEKVIKEIQESITEQNFDLQKMLLENKDQNEEIDCLQQAEEQNGQIIQHQDKLIRELKITNKSLDLKASLATATEPEYEEEDPFNYDHKTLDELKTICHKKDKKILVCSRAIQELQEDLKGVEAMREGLTQYERVCTIISTALEVVQD